MSYKYKLEQCDVFDKPKLVTYRQKRADWLHQLNGDRDHAIWKQITSMLWNDAIFRSANEARRLSHAAGYPSSARNWSIAQFMDQGYVATQTLSIRKLMEKGSRDRNKQVISLRRLLDDMKDNRDLLTRENYVAYDGLPYDPGPGEQSYYEDIIENGQGIRVGWLSTEGPDAWSTAQLVQEKFDRLSGVSAQSRSRNDLIRPEAFEKIEDALQNCGWQDIVKYGNKFIAHAADEHSRSSILKSQKGLSLNKISKCHEGISRATALIDAQILYESSHSHFPIPQFNHFENLDKQWVSSEHAVELSEFWEKHVAAVDKWSSDNVLP